MRHSPKLILKLQNNQTKLHLKLGERSGNSSGNTRSTSELSQLCPLRRWVLGRGETTAQLLLAACPGCAFGGFSSVSVFIPLGNLGGNHQLMVMFSYFRNCATSWASTYTIWSLSPAQGLCSFIWGVECRTI